MAATNSVFGSSIKATLNGTTRIPAYTSGTSGNEYILPTDSLTVSTTTTSATASIDAAAILGQDIVSWAPASTTAVTFVTGRMRKTVLNLTNGGLTSPSHAIGAYDYLEVTAGTNTADLLFVHEAKYKKAGTATVNNISFYKPAIDTVTGTHANITLYDGDMDLSGVTYTNAYLMNNANRSYLAFNTIGTMTGATGNQIPTSVWPCMATSRYYFPRGWGSASTAAPNKDILIAGPPIVISERTTFQTIGINVTAGVASSTITLAIYKMGANGIPTTKVYGSGALTSTGTGLIEATSINTTLEAGAYHLCYQTNGGATGPTVSCVAFTDGFLNEVFGNHSGNPSSATAEDWLYVAGAVAGSTPSTFGTPTRLRVGAVPAVYLKK